MSTDNYTSTTKKKVFSGLIWTVAERFGAQGVSFIVSIVLARLLMPEDYGTIALITVFTNILSVFVSSGMGTALVQKKDADDLDFSSVFYFNIATSVVLYLMIFFCAPFISDFYNNQELTALTRVISITLLIAGVNNVQRSYVSKTMQFRKFFFSTIIGTIISAVVGIVLAYKGFGCWALVAQQLTNSTMDMIILWFTVKWRPKWLFSFQRLKSLFSYGWKLLVSSLIDILYGDARTLIIGKKYSSADLGLYNKGNSFPSLIATNITGPIDSVLMPAMSQEQDNTERVKAMTRRAIKTSTYIIAPFMLGLAAIAPVLVKLLLTEKWLECVPYMQIFCITYMFYPIHTANLNAIKAMGRSDLFLKLEIAKKVIGFATIFASMWFGPFVMCCSTLFSSVVSQIINSWPNKKLLNYSYLAQLKDILPNILLALGMGACVYCFNYLPIPEILTLIIQIAVGAGLYIGGSILLKNDSFAYLWGIIQDFFHKRKKAQEQPKKKILLLGGSAQQVVAIETAKKLGYYTVLCDFLTDNPGQYVADKFYLTSTTDMQAVLEIAKKEKIDGVLAYASDPAAPTAAYIAEQLGLAGNPYASVDILCNKDKFRKFLKENGINTPQARGYSSAEEAVRDIEDNVFAFPVIVKPVDSSGSKGATVLKRKDGVQEAVAFALSFSRSKRIVVEEFIEKKHPYLIGGDIFVSQGKVILWGLMNCHRDGKGNPLVPIGKSYPPELEEVDLQKVKQTLQNLCDALQFENGAMNVELIVDRNGRVFPIDIGPRSGGNMIPDLLGMIFGVDVVEWSVRVAMGETVQAVEMQDNLYYATHNLHSLQNGVFHEVVFAEELEKYVVKKCIYKKEGDKIEFFDNASKAIGIVFFHFDTEENMKKYLENIGDYIQIKVKE